MSYRNRTHIKRDGSYLCLVFANTFEKKWILKQELNNISFNEAIEMENLDRICVKCVKHFYTKINRLKNLFKCKI